MGCPVGWWVSKIRARMKGLLHRYFEEFHIEWKLNYVTSKWHSNLKDSMLNVLSGRLVKEPIYYDSWSNLLSFMFSSCHQQRWFFFFFFLDYGDLHLPACLLYILLRNCVLIWGAWKKKKRKGAPSISIKLLLPTQNNHLHAR